MFSHYLKRHVNELIAKYGNTAVEFFYFSLVGLTMVILNLGFTSIDHLG